MNFTREHIATRLALHRPSDPMDVLVGERSAVAAVLRFSRGPAEVLLMQRATREGDRWSGHVSFPGGRAEPSDPDLHATAIRETREELGLDLVTHAAPLGRLDGVRAIAHGKPLSMTITPWVFALEREPEFRLSEEATAAFWLPLDRAAAGEFDGEYPWKKGPMELKLPCWNYEGHVVWGLTFGMLRNMLEIIGAR